MKVNARRMGRPQKSIQDHILEGTLNTTRHASRLAQELGPSIAAAARKVQAKRWLMTGDDALRPDHLKRSGFRNASARALWRKLQKELLAECHLTRPAAWWHFDGYLRDEGQPESEQIYSLGMLRDDELLLLRHLNPVYHSWPFRRWWSFWALQSPEPRDDAVSELDQLERMGVLTDRERTYLADPARCRSGMCGGRTSWYYLTRPELERLDLWERHRSRWAEYHDQRPPVTFLSIPSSLLYERPDV